MRAPTSFLVHCVAALALAISARDASGCPAARVNSVVGPPAVRATATGFTAAWRVNSGSGRVSIETVMLDPTGRALGAAEARTEEAGELQLSPDGATLTVVTPAATGAPRLIAIGPAIGTGKLTTVSITPDGPAWQVIARSDGAIVRAGSTLIALDRGGRVLARTSHPELARADSPYIWMVPLADRVALLRLHAATVRVGYASSDGTTLESWDDPSTSWEVSGPIFAAIARRGSLLVFGGRGDNIAVTRVDAAGSVQPLPDLSLLDADGNGLPAKVFDDGEDVLLEGEDVRRNEIKVLRVGPDGLSRGEPVLREKLARTARLAGCGHGRCFSVDVGDTRDHVAARELGPKGELLASHPLGPLEGEAGGCPSSRSPFSCSVTTPRSGSTSTSFVLAALGIASALASRRARPRAA